MIQNKRQFVNFLNSHINYEKNREISYHKKNYNKNFISSFLEKIHFFYRNQKIIHIAGTNGKGSVALILSYLLSSLNISNGTYTSPHLIQINERIRIQNKIISDSLLLKSANRVQNLLPEISFSPTFFDLLTAIALLSFENCEYIILETGMGGRLDSTNIQSENKLCILTRIALDHTSHLGNSIESIAQEKLGIIQNNNSVILAEQVPKIYSLVQKVILEKKAVLFQYGKDFFVDSLKIEKEASYFSFFSKHSKEKTEIKTSFLTKEQSHNLALCLFALQILGIEWNSLQINQKIKNFTLYLTLPGRFQLINRSPKILLDGGHNPEAIKFLRKNLELHYSNTRRKFLIISISQDKDYTMILKEILSFFEEVFVIRLHSSMKKDISQLIFQQAQKIHSQVRYASSFAEAFQKLKEKIKDDDLLVVTGSFYLVGESLDFFNLGHSI